MRKSVSWIEPKTRNKTLVDLSLCLVTNREDVQDENEFIWRVQEAVLGGVTIVQIRDSLHDLRDTIRSALTLQPFLEAHNVPLIINNRIDVVLALKSRYKDSLLGAHLGSKDFPIDEARRLLGPTCILGKTVNTLREVEEAEREKDLIDYLGLSQLFPSKNSKPDCPSEGEWGYEGLKSALERSDLPFMPIGGIGEENLAEVWRILNSGSHGKKHGVAVIGKLWRDKSPRNVAVRYWQIMELVMRRVEDQYAKQHHMEQFEKEQAVG